MSNDFENELKVVFLDEASQLLEEAEASFLDLEANPERLDLIEKIFRLAHNLKGSAKAVGFLDINHVAHEFETLLLKIKSGEIPNSKIIVSTMLKAIDFIRDTVGNLKSDLSFRASTEDITKLLVDTYQNPPNESQDLVNTSEVQQAPESIPSEETKPVIEDGFVNFSEENISPTSEVKNQQTSEEIKSPSPQVIKEREKENKSTAPTSSAEETIRINLNRLERLINSVGEVVILNSVLQQQVLETSSQELKNTSLQLSKATREIQDLSMSLRMLPLKSIFQKMNRIVRDTSGMLQKQVSFISQGEETEVDKTVFEKISDPLVHLIRNAVDHGIESPQDRIALGKPAQGTVKLLASQKSGKLHIEIIDDGKGLDAEGLRKSAIKKNLISAQKVLSEQECYQLIFLPGFSTKDVVTDVSGRGVGMDVVKTNIKDLGGSISIETQKGKGSRFTISLPLSLAIIDGMIVRAGDQRFVIPLSLVHETVRFDTQTSIPSTALGEVLKLRNENLKLIRLTQSLGLKALPPSANLNLNQLNEPAVVVVRNEKQAFGVVIDEIIRRTQIVVKPLTAEMQSMPGLSGVTILGDGKPAFIVDLIDLHSKKRGAA